MKNTNKKGFTIVELVIVVAVIAILAAVLIPTFSGLVKKANLSADQQAVRQMNTALAIHAAENGVPKNVTEAKKALGEQLVNVEGGLVPITKGYAFYWDSAKNEIVLVAYGDEIQEGWELLTANAYGELISVSSADELVAALAKASETPVSITLKSDINFDVAGTLANVQGNANVLEWKALDIVEANEIVEIDLNGHTLTLGDDAELGWHIIDGALTVKNGTISSSNQKQVIRSQGGTLVLTDVVINHIDDVADDNHYLECVISARGISDTAITGCTITSNAMQGIGTNSNNATTDGIRISIVDTKITVKDCTRANYVTTAVLINVVADITIDGCTFEGEQHGLLLRGNSAVVKNSTFIYNAEKATTYTNYGSGNMVPAGSLVLHAGGAYGDDATFTYTFENVIADVVKAGTTDNGKLVISGIEVDEVTEEDIEGSIVVK